MTQENERPGMSEDAPMIFVPTVIETTHKGERGFDIFSRLLRDRVIYLGTPINDTVSNIVVAQLLYLESEDAKADIFMYINSPGGSVTAGMAIYDTMQFIHAPVSTLCLGIAASMGAFLLAAGAKGKRKILPNAEVMIHQVLGGVMGQATDIEIHAKHMLKMKENLNKLLAKHTGQPLEKVCADTERDYFLTADEAIAYGLVDEIVSKKPDPQP